MSGPSFNFDGLSGASGGPAAGETWSREAGSGGQAQPRRPGGGTQDGPGGHGPGEGGSENWSWGPQGCEGQLQQCGPGGDSESWTRPGQKSGCGGQPQPQPQQCGPGSDSWTRQGQKEGCGGQPQPQQCGPGDNSESSWSWDQQDCGGQPPHGENRSPCGPGGRPQNRPGCEQDVRQGHGHGHGGRC